MSVPEVRNGIKTLVSKLYAGSDMATMFHEDFHGLRRRAREAGTITREDEIQLLRAMDQVLSGRNVSRDGTGAELRFIPEGIEDSAISETRLDEAMAQIGEMELFRSRPDKGGKNALGVPRQTVATHIGAIARLAPEAARKFKAFFAAVKARWGLAITRLYTLKKAEKAGKFDRSTLESYLDKLMGTDQQKEHDQRTAAEFKRVMSLPEDLPGDAIPLSLVKADADYLNLAKDPEKNREELQRIVNERAKAAGYKGQPDIYGNSSKSKKGSLSQQVAVFNPDQIKSADPVTRDAQGNVIPLSERFNPESARISLSLGPADTAGILSGDALSRIEDPRRRAQAMIRIARNFDELKVSTERALLLSKTKQGKGELKRQANLQEEMLADKYVGEAYAKHQGILSNEDLTKIKSQPGHELLANPDTHLRGRVMSKREAIRQHPDMFIVNRPGDYDGADGVGRSVFGGSLMPDQAAQELYAAHLIKEPTPDAMWALLKQEQAHVDKMKAAEISAKDDIRAAKLRAKEEANVWLAERTGDQEANFSQKGQILRSLAGMDAILSALPPDIAGRIGGHTQMARIGTEETRLRYLQEKLAKADAELGKYLKQEFGKEFKGLLESSRPERDTPGQRPKGKLGPDIHDIFRAAESAMGLTGVNARNLLLG